MKARTENSSEKLVERIESISNDIQLLALNIAVAAAKMAQKYDPGLEVHQKLSSLVSQTTQAIKQMNQIISAARAENLAGNSVAEYNTGQIDQELIESMESAMNGIIADSEKITRLLTRIRRR